MIAFKDQRRSLLSSSARVQAPWVKVTIGTFTFGVYDRKTKFKDNKSFYQMTEQFPNYIQDLNVVKINGQINQYTLRISYPVRQTDDPNFFEKVFSSVSDTRKITFSYGDSSAPNFAYKDEEAIITKIQQTFNLESSVISYTVSAVSDAALGKSGSYTFPSDGKPKKPSTIIKNLFLNNTYKLQDIFTGMNKDNIDSLIAGDDAAVQIDTKINISVLDYISYLVSCMIPSGTTRQSNISNDIYILTIHDETIYSESGLNTDIQGPHFKVTRTSYRSEQTDAYQLDIGYNTNTLVTQFSVEQNDNYSIYYNYQKKLHEQVYTSKLNADGEWERNYAPTSTSNGKFETDPDDITWWTKITKYPINATVTVQGLLRPAMLMTHLRLNIIFPGGHKHIASGLYIVTKQIDSINSSGYKTQLSLTKISGDTSPNVN